MSWQIDESDFHWGGLHNFCRNPNGDKKGLWCYVKKDGSKEYCGEPSKREACNEKYDEGSEFPGMNYKGCLMKTRSGYSCQEWAKQEPYKHGMAAKMDASDKNYCRNSSKSKIGFWCYTTHPKKRWEHCDPQALPGNIVGRLPGSNGAMQAGTEPYMWKKEEKFLWPRKKFCVERSVSSSFYSKIL